MMKLLKRSLSYFPRIYNSLILFRFDCFRSAYASFALKDIATFLSDEERNNPKVFRRVQRDVLKCNLKYGSSAIEYFLYGFRNKKPSEKASFLTDSFRENLLARVEGFGDVKQVLDNKYSFYKRNENFFLRSCMLIPVGGGNLEDFVTFSTTRGKVFIKPNCDSCGRGANLAKVCDEGDAKKIFNDLVETNVEWIVEEVIEQDASMAQWNETSVNTIRIPAILTSKGFHIMTPSIRTGIKGAVVDNAGSGGILANVDFKTGKIYTNGVDESGHTFENHPTSGVKFKDSIVPHWSELMLLVEKIHSTTMSSNKYIGWDFALSKRGWCLIEGNWGQMICQYADKKGRKEEFVQYLLS